MQQARYRRHESDLGCWEVVARDPAYALLPYVRSYVGWNENIAGFRQRRELPSGTTPMLISLDTPYRIGAPIDGHTPHAYDAFVAGNHDTYATSETGGEQSGVQVTFTALGARVVFGVPMHELTNRVLAVEDVLGGEGRILTEQLRSAPSWDARFEVLDTAFTARIAAARPLDPGIVFAVTRLGCGGAEASIGTTARTLGVSHRTLIDGFRDHIGLTPRMARRVARFDRTVQAIAAGPPASLAALAADCGYYDQPHLHRDFRQFAGLTPAEYIRRLAPDNGGLIGD